MNVRWILLLGVALFFYGSYYSAKNFNLNAQHSVGDALDSLNGVKVYYNGGVSHVGARNVSSDGYNIGLEYQCVEFVKRYYYEYYHHKMPDSYGHAVDFFDRGLSDGKLNSRRGLIQYSNPGTSMPQPGDLVVVDGNSLNPYGHVAIVSAVDLNGVEFIQQNPGPFAPSRVSYSLEQTGGKWRIDRDDVLGWLRMK